MNDKIEEPVDSKKDRMIAKALGEEIAITPSDIYNQDFMRAFLGGYEIKEVDTFLERVADIIEHLIDQIRYLREKVDEQRATIEEYREIEKTLQKPGRSPARRRQKTGRPDGPAKRGETSVEIKKRATENP